MARHAAEPRECRLIFRCTDREHQRLLAAARDRGQSFSDFARERLLAERPDLRTGPPAHPMAHLDGAARELAFQIRKVGVNLHQLVKRLNIHKSAPPNDLPELLDKIRSLIDKAASL
jgi:hypothetical protein